MLVLLVTISLVVSSKSKQKRLAGLLHRTKRSTGNCIESSTHRSDIFPRMANITCKPGCNKVEYEVQYAVVKIKIEKVVVGCRETQLLPNSQVNYNPITGTFARVCKDGFKPMKANITTLHETDDRLEARRTEIIIDCV